MADGWRPAPFREFVLKIHSRCDLACDYCYMYAMADQSWRSQPRRMSLATAEQAAKRIGEHVRQHGLEEIGLVLHGGEPLLAGPDLIAYLITAVRGAVGEGVIVHATVQTNGVGLDDPYLALFDKLGIRVGVSLDGSQSAQDRHRRFASGRSSHAAVTAGLRRLTAKRYRHLFGGLLCVIDLRNDPVDTYEALLEFKPPRIDFLFPHGTWESPPPGRALGTDDAPYADWLIAVFNQWYDYPQTDIRIFTEIVRLMLGGSSRNEVVGLGAASMLVIETNGSIEQVDTLKAAFHGAPRTGLHVEHDPLDAALELPEIAARQLGLRGLADECQKCRIRRICGGGLYTHRYRRGTGFANPSVYCPDLMRLISHIRETIEPDVAQNLAKLGAH
ncbi:MAG: FxsB family radical SAM/SPASM domain protein [Streptosporangiaceae bacterium]|nr:FxsB family radical SAM/SPASM domain protein [Streptosporangiaceae bacterium]MBV9853201.1 FxsB family radical SAM/SPASM domain protein [Streptosporangiaceae bacterium]